MTNARGSLQTNSQLEFNNLSLPHSVASSIASTSITIQNSLPVPQNVHIGVKCPTTGVENVFVVKSTESVGHLRLHAVLQSFLNIKEALNFGLYLPPQGGKKGKFLEEERPISDYPVLLQNSDLRSQDNDTTSNSANTLTNGMQESLDSGVGHDHCWLELVFKGRMDIDDSQNQSRIRKLKTKVTQNHFMDMVRNQDVKGIEKLLAKGFDPNFWSRKDGEAPITAAATIFHPREVIIALVSGGAHVDFRAQDSHTALHRAAICGNYEAIQTLLDLGQNPNCRDWQGLTPLYYAVSTDISARCTHALLYDHAVIGVEDEHGFEEIHQACKANRTQHLENLIAYGADLNARTKRGQTPLHLCVWHESDACLRQLLLRGADPTEVNEDNQTPLEYALLTNRNEQAAILQNFDPANVVAIRDPPSYNASRRPTVNGPRGAVTRNYPHKSFLSIADSASVSTDVLSTSDSLLSADRISMQNITSSLATKGSIYCSGASDEVQTNSNKSPFLRVAEDYPISLGGTPKVRRAAFHEKRPQTFVPSQMLMSPYDIRQEKFYTRTIAIRRGQNGFGFTLNGIPRKALNLHGRQPLPNTPSNQYLSTVVPDGPADRAGAREGDYVVEIDGQDVTDACHEDAVECIKNCGDSLIMRVTTVYRGSILSQPKGHSDKGKITHAPMRFPLSNGTIETSDTSSSVSSSSMLEDEIIHIHPTPPISAGEPCLGSTWRVSRNCMPPAIEERSRSRDHQPRISLQRTLSSGQFNEQITLHSRSPTACTKERVFVFAEINGKTRAVALVDSNSKKEGPHSRSAVRFAGDRSSSQSIDRLTRRSGLDLETRNHSHRAADLTIERTREDRKIPTTALPENDTSSPYPPRGILRSRLAFGSLRRVNQSDDSVAARSINFHDDQSISHNSSKQKRLLRTDFTRSMSRLGAKADCTNT